MYYKKVHKKNRRVYGIHSQQGKTGNRVGALAEGTTIRSIERMTGIHRDTIMRLGVRIGQKCKKILYEKMRGLSGDRF